MWGELDKKMEQEMLSSTRELQQCVIAINRDIQTIADNPISKDAKKSLLLAAKSLMQRTVRPQHLTQHTPTHTTQHTNIH